MTMHQAAQNHLEPARVRTGPVEPDRANDAEQLSVPTLVALHLAPGALVIIAFVFCAPLVKAPGFPPIAALLAAILFVLVPVELGIVDEQQHRTGGQRDGERFLVPVAARRADARDRAMVYAVWSGTSISAAHVLEST